jgi:hypothetical protein
MRRRCRITSWVELQALWGKGHYRVAAGSALVEQKNGAVVRHFVGYDRFASKRAYAQLPASTPWPVCT